MSLQLFDLIALILSLLAFIVTLFVTISLLSSYRRSRLETLGIYILVMVFFSIHTLSHTLLFLSTPRISFLGKNLSFFDVIHTVAAFLGALAIYVAIEYSAHKSIPWRATIIFFLSGAALAAEFLGKDPVADTLAFYTELFGVILISLAFLSIFIPIYKNMLRGVGKSLYVAYFVGFILFLTSLVTNVFATYFQLPVYLRDVWEIQYLVGILLISYVVNKKPFLLIETYARPKTIIITDKSGKVFYTYHIDRSMTRVGREMFEEFTRLLPDLLTKTIKPNSWLESIKFRNFEIIVKVGKETIGYFVLEKASKISEHILESTLREFEERIYPLLKEGRFKDRDVEEIHQFDYMVKKIIAEATI